MYILIHSCDICNICYLLLMLYCALVLFLGWRLSTERVVAQPLHLYLFPPGVNTIGGLQTCILICNSIRLCICTLDLNNASVELCNSFLSVNVILNRKC